ncbi:hypothetical protein PCOAH_00036480 [Plasmodium coatneyi]|uniref:SICA antigen n=1 Tax=Plasmodium coatneyi TaxID=208452 RepID=A0A1B1E1X6_9APIC|nr:hypothetical protein PCOAH_00036480 [Plasmodium coatneyi]ANQ09034.1 hypothetical protein PCOAH_00036480 [Plasmodium coatneyi]
MVNVPKVEVSKDDVPMEQIPNSDSGFRIFLRMMFLREDFPKDDVPKEGVSKEQVPCSDSGFRV